jgi:competence protein ComEC
MTRALRGLVSVALLAALIAVAVLLARREKPPNPGPDYVPQSGRLVASFLDVGQGDAELIQLPGGEAILIDSGDRGAPTVDLLRGLGIGHLDLIIATHPHSDHIGEMRDVMRAFRVDEFWDSGFRHPTRTYGDMLEEIRKQGIRLATPKRGFARRMGEVLIEVLNPPEPPINNEANDASLVVRFAYGQTRFLFAGDAETGAWQNMIEAGRDGLQANVLKAAHHGSSNGTTAEVLDAVGPAIFMISCASGNDYSHPGARVMRLLEGVREKVSVYRTDLEGTITAVSDGNRIDVNVERRISPERRYLTGDEVAGKLAAEPVFEKVPRRTRAARAR